MTNKPIKEQEVDVFLWANQADAHKDELDIDLFVYTKGYTVYSVTYTKELTAKLRLLFLYDMLSQVQTGAATGMAIRPIERQSEENELKWIDVERVEHAQEVLEQIQYSEENLEVFDDNCDTNKLRGIVMRLTRNKESFYIVKNLPKSQIIKAGASMTLDTTGKFMPSTGIAAMKVQPGNETLVVGNRIFVFNEPAFIKQFGYDAQTDEKVRSQIARIESYYKLKYPEDVSLYTCAEGNKTLRDKLLRADPTLYTQKQLIDQAEQFSIGLMTDDATGEIIIMDKRNAEIFANLLNDDYVDSDMTGARYLAAKKKEVNVADEAQTGMAL